MSATRNRWTAYYQAQGQRLPRTLLVDALDRFETEGSPGSERVAIDLGCGAGTETIAMLARGWRVLAIDAEPEAVALLESTVSPVHRAQLETTIATFDDVTLPPADLVWAGFSLPFCPPEHFDALWSQIAASIAGAGRFAGQFFGERDSWASNGTMTFHTADQVRRLLGEFKTEVFHEVDEDGVAVSGPKHWHVFDVIARKAEAKY